MSKHILSKSTFIKGVQCEKQLYLYKYFPQLQDKVSGVQQAVFDRGHEVGKLAQQLFPGGIDASPDSFKDYSEALKLTEYSIGKNVNVIYEAAFQYDDVLVASDIVVREGNKWKVYEVKSSTNVNNTNVLDAAVQYYVISNLGIEISDFFIITINNSYVRKGELDIHSLFKNESVLKRIEKLQPFVEKKVAKLKTVLGMSDVPGVNIGDYCTTPYNCSFYGHCWKDIPADSVFEISGMHLRKKFELLKSDIIKIKDIPADFPLPASQRMQVDSFKSNNIIVDRHSIKKFLNNFTYPLYFLDFESFQPAVPLYENSKPYQQIPFQYSLHIKESAESELEHYEYLAQTEGDPRVEFISRLLDDIGGNGMIIVYNKSYEEGRLKELARDFPVYADKLETVIERIYDLMIPFQKKYYYAPSMKGSYSIKYVLPALVPELDYENMGISNGMDASIGFENLQNETDMFRIEEIRKHLLEYCKLDTYAMVKILEKLERVASGK